MRRKVDHHPRRRRGWLQPAYGWALTKPGARAALKAHRTELFDAKAHQYHGRVIKLMGDGVLMEFASVVDATCFAVEVQCAMRERNAHVAEEQRILLRIVNNVGDIIVEGDDIYGDGVNIASRLENLADRPKGDGPCACPPIDRL